MKFLKNSFTLLRHTAISFSDDNAFKLAASLSYYTLFALGPFLIILLSLSSIIYGRDAVQGRIFMQLKGVIGSDAALQIQDILSNAHQTHATTAGAVIGVIILVVVATGIFTEMQGSINFIWSVKAKPKKGWLKFLINRLLSFILVLSLSIMLFASLLVNTLLGLLSARLTRVMPNYTIYLIDTLSFIIILITLTGLFTVIFKILPDAIISWKDALIGSAFTAVLFFIGKYLISLYIHKSTLGTSYGTAASIVIILAWVYYVAAIIYFGAEFTKIYALHSGEGIRPKSTAVFIIKREEKEVPPSRLNG